MKTLGILLCIVSLLTISVNSNAQKKVVYKQKQGWSPQAKNAAIGAGAGAILGAVIDKKHRGTGAVIGGVAGAGVGYLYGRHRAHEKQEDSRPQTEVVYKGYRTPHSSRSYNSANTTTNSSYLSSSEANAAYDPNDVNGTYAFNYFHNPAYGYQRKSW
jgi:uncharacterized membrane protein YebE (DUF533 family)